MKVRLPGRCSACGADVVWNGKQWKTAPMRVGSHKHRCLDVCGAWMPYVHEPCARRPGHRYEHRTRYAMDNALVMKTGRKVA